MLNKSTFLASLIIGSVLSCSVANAQSKSKGKAAAPKGFKVSPNNLVYKLVRTSKSSRSSQMSDVLSFRAQYFIAKNNQDSLLFDSKVNPGGMVTLQLSAPTYKGDLMEGLAMMHQGDSATFLVPADSFFLKTVQLEQLPPFIQAGEKIRFEIGMVEINTMEEMQKKQAVLDSISQIEMKTQNEKEMQVLLAKMAEKGESQTPEPSGLIIIQRQKGNGVKPLAGQKVSVHYTGTLLDGTVFDSSVQRNEPIAFTLGEGQVIKGWDEGIAAIEVGGKATLMIPSWLAYGARAMGPIPANSSLIFEVELVQID